MRLQIYYVLYFTPKKVYGGIAFYRMIKDTTI